MNEHTSKDDYEAQIRTIFADQEMVAAMRRNFPNQGEPVDPVVRDRRWDEAVATFGRDDADWWIPRKTDGK